MNVVVDTNVLVSAALFPHSVPRRAVDVVLHSGRLLTSDEVLAELDKVLRRPKFDRIRPLAERLELLNGCVLLGRLVAITTPVVACRDPNDDMFLAVAVNGRADYLVSGDADLLALHPFRGIPILSPADFLTAVGAAP